jgi:hypothetical protein
MWIHAVLTDRRALHSAYAHIKTLTPSSSSVVYLQRVDNTTRTWEEILT